MATTSYVDPVRRRRNPIRRVIEALLAVVVVVLLILAIFLAVLARHGTDGETTVLGRPVYSVASGSMAPTFNTGDMIIDKPISQAAARHLHKGQIITFQAAQGQGSNSALLITHRIYAVVKNPAGAGVTSVEYRTKGDANNAPDPGLLSPSAVLGVYQQRIPFGGYILSSLHQPITFVILVLIPVVYLVEEEVRRRWTALGVQDAQRKRAAANHQSDIQ